MLVCLLLLLRFTLRLPEESLSGIFKKIEIFDQKLDHFDPTSTERFQQRYAVNDTFHNGPENGKIILYISGEQHMSEQQVNSSSAFVQVAKDTGAVMATLEHRFYGLSVPLDLTTENLTKYHNTDQALEDLADFVVFLKEKYCAKTAEVPLLIVGVRYAGSMSYFFRQKFPHLSKYSWSSSPPLDIHNNFSEYDDHLARVIEATSEKCYENTVAMMNEIHRIVSENGSDYWVLRDRMGLNGTKSKHPTSVLEMLVDQLAVMIQYMTRSSDLQDFCRNQSGPSYDLDSFIEYFRATNPDPAAGDSLLLTDESRFSDMVDSRSWTWQTCNEYGWFQTASGRLRSPWVNLSYYQEICETLFNGTELPDQSSVSRRYGGVNPKTTNIVFAYGAVDPWTRLGVDFETEIIDNVPVHDSLNRYAFFIENSSHCSELSLERDSDSEDLKMKRRMIQQIVTNWLNDDCPSRCQHGDCISGVCVCHENYRGDRCDTRTISSNIFKACSSLLVLVPTVMMIVVGISAWHLFKKDRSENEIRTIS